MHYEVLEGPRRRARLLTAVAVALVLALAMFGAAAQSASASATCAASWSLSASSWGPWTDFTPCGYTARTQFMRADYNGAGTVPVCEQTQLAATGQLISEICANNHAQSGDLSVNYWTQWKRMRAKNNSGSAHTIWGSDYEI